MARVALSVDHLKWSLNTLHGIKSVTNGGIRRGFRAGGSGSNSFMLSEHLDVLAEQSWEPKVVSRQYQQG